MGGLPVFADDLSPELGKQAVFDVRGDPWIVQSGQDWSGLYNIHCRLVEPSGPE